MISKALAERIAQLPQTDNQTDANVLRARQKHKRSHMYWTAEEDDILAELAQLISSADSSRELQRSLGAIDSRKNHLQLRPLVTTPVLEKPKIDYSTRNPILNMLHYWRNSLLDEAKIGLSYADMSKGIKCSLQEIKQGSLPLPKIKALFAKADAELKEKQKKSDTDDVFVKKIAIIIAPVTALKKYDRGQIFNTNQTQAFFPLWLTAELTREGRLIPTEELCYPWIERQCLTPNEQDNIKSNIPILGDVSDVDHFYDHYSNNLKSEHLDWQTFAHFAFNLLATLCNKNHDTLTQQHMTLIEEGYFIPFSMIQDTAKSIINTYDQYILHPDRIIPPLLHQWCSLTNNTPRPDATASELLLANQHHLGQMENAYPLSKTQRTSLNYFVDAADNDIFTIHGPPGTGKTTLLLSVIASQWVAAAIAQAMPPITVATSTNNQAVTNILDAFGKAGAANRWLPELKSFGIYLCSAEKGKEARDTYCYELKDGSGATTSLYTEAYRARATDYFIEHFNQHFQKDEHRIDTCIQHLHSCLVAKHQLLLQTIEFITSYSDLQQKIARYADNIEGINQLLEEHEAIHVRLENEVYGVKELRSQWISYQYTTLKWLHMLQWLPFIKSLLRGKIQLFSATHHDFFPELMDSAANIDTFFEQQLAAKIAMLQKNKAVIDEFRTLIIAYQQCLSSKYDLENALGFELMLDQLYDYNAPQHVNCLLDTSLRYDLFILTCHYWEARWLLESSQRTGLTKSRDDRQRYWQIQAMLTPCSVTTLYMCPSFFSYQTASKQLETLEQFTDLLIIDEAGQVLPSLAGAASATAKRMLLVGDAKQIEPVFKIPEHIDMANAKTFNLCHDEASYEQLKHLGILCSGNSSNSHSYGNAIILSQHKAKHHLANHTYPGMLLTEHRRCPKEIISYCNELCYENTLIPLTKEKSSIFPRMGYAHIKGCEEKEGGSRCNKQEARVIAHWLAKNKDKILADCHSADLAKCVAVITPFAAQRRAIEKALLEYNIKLDKVGTVHSMQGAEKELVIFSTVYTASSKTHQLFFDKSVNMLNVAVSRAKSSFLVFGDMDIFDTNQHYPSSLLAKYLFASEDNEIIDIIQPDYGDFSDTEIDSITTLDKHRHELKDAFTKAKHELNIVSPYLKSGALINDAIPALITQFRATIAINIYTEPNLNKRSLDFNQAVALLTEAGAKVILVHQVHSKIIAIDREKLIIGSFNWLSASRTNKRYMMEESSLIYSGDKVPELIETFMKPIRSSAMNVLETV